MDSKRKYVDTAMAEVLNLVEHMGLNPVYLVVQGSTNYNLDVYSDEYMNMLKYCIENLKPIDNNIISMFIKKQGDLVNERKVYKNIDLMKLEKAIYKKS